MNQNCVERMKSDRVYRGSVLYYLYAMADSCVALAEMIIKLKNLPKPQSYSEAIDIIAFNQSAQFLVAPKTACKSSK